MVNWVLFGVLAAGALAVLGAEITGIVRHSEHRIDTVSEIYWAVRQRVGRYRVPLAVGLAVFLSWMWYHFTFEGRSMRQR